MLLNIIRFIRGYVDFEVFGRFPERFMNLCIKNGVRLFAPQPTPRGISASMLVTDYRHIRRISSRAGVRLRITRRHGVPFLIDRYKNRKGLLVGTFLFIFIALMLQNFVWTVDINGLETLSYSELSILLSDGGLSAGAYKNSLKLQSFQRSVMQDVEEIGWMSVNIIGTKAEIEIKEKALKPQIEDTSVPCNIVADCDGLILSTNVKNGKSHTAQGSAVIEGQLLVSGAVEDALGGIRYVHADAEIIATTQHSHSFYVPKNIDYLKPTHQSLRRNLIFLWLDIPLTCRNIGGDYTSLVTTEQVSLQKNIIPFGIRNEYINTFERLAVSVSKQQSDRILSSEEALYRLFVLNNCTEIGVSDILSETDDGYILHCDYTCTEDIAKKENLVVN